MYKILRVLWHRMRVGAYFVPLQIMLQNITSTVAPLIACVLFSHCYDNYHYICTVYSVQCTNMTACNLNITISKWHFEQVAKSNLWWHHICCCLCLALSLSLSPSVSFDVSFKLSLKMGNIVWRLWIVYLYPDIYFQQFNILILVSSRTSQNMAFSWFNLC